MLICTPLQFIFEFMCVVLARTKITDRKNTQENFKLLSFQIIVTLIFVYIIAHSTYFIEILANDGNPGLVFLTLILSICFDQIKSVLFLGTIYVVIVRRFNHLAVNEEDYVSKEILAIPP